MNTAKITEAAENLEVSLDLASKSVSDLGTKISELVKTVADAAALVPDVAFMRAVAAALSATDSGGLKASLEEAKFFLKRARAETSDLAKAISDLEI